MPRLHLDVKTTVWERRTLRLEEPEYSELIEKLKTLKNSESWNIIDEFENDYSPEYETLYDTSDNISLEQNDYDPTADLSTDDGVVIFKNESKDVIRKRKSSDEWQSFFDWLESIDTNATVFTDELRQSIIDAIYERT
jgi:light-regulated signal transduction histidine kinase (bacteriophytochrome)